METLLLGSIFAAAFVFAAILLLVGVIRLVLGVVFLPFKILFAVLLLPFWAARFVLRIAGLLLVLPFLVVSGGAVLLVVVLGGLLIAALPVAVGVAALLWMMVRAVVRPSTAVALR
jgi:hypothetical protein